MVRAVRLRRSGRVTTSPRRHPFRFFSTTFLVLSTGAAAALHYTLGWHPLLTWLLACNTVTLALWRFDKWQSRRSGGRVPEATLHLMAFLGATPASFAAMWLFRHKTLKPSFKILYVLFLSAQAVAAYLVWSGGQR